MLTALQQQVQSLPSGCLSTPPPTRRPGEPVAGCVRGCATRSTEEQSGCGTRCCTNSNHAATLERLCCPPAACPRLLHVRTRYHSGCCAWEGFDVTQREEVDVERAAAHTPVPRWCRSRTALQLHVHVHDAVVTLGNLRLVA